MTSVKIRTMYKEGFELRAKTAHVNPTHFNLLHKDCYRRNQRGGNALDGVPAHINEGKKKVFGKLATVGGIVFFQPNKD